MSGMLGIELIDTDGAIDVMDDGRIPSEVVMFRGLVWGAEEVVCCCCCGCGCCQPHLRLRPSPM